MNRVLKTLLLWLLVSALPVQAFAAAVRLSCGPVHHSNAAAETRTSAHEQHEAGHGDHRHDAVQAASTADNTDDTVSYQSGYCSACAACCVGALAPPAAVDWTPAYASSFAPAASPIASFTAHIPSGLERPPRHI
ncbi:MAG: hypothetical protein ACREX0_16985, partial [Noviherbaspirillum sp.]